MTAPVTPALPPTPAASASSPDTGDSRAPFASALGDALSAGHGPTAKAPGRGSAPGRDGGDHGPDDRPGRGVRAGRSHLPSEPSDDGGPDDTVASADDPTTPLNGLPALLWSVLQGGQPPATDAPAAPGPDPVGATGAVGAATGAPGLPAGPVAATLAGPPMPAPADDPATGTPVPGPATGPALASLPDASADPAGTPAGGPIGDQVPAAAGGLVVVDAGGTTTGGTLPAPPATDAVASTSPAAPADLTVTVVPGAEAGPRPAPEASAPEPAAGDTGLPAVEPIAVPGPGSGGAAADRDGDSSDSSRRGARPATPLEAGSAVGPAGLPAPAPVTATTPAAPAPASAPAPPVAGQLVPHVAVLGRAGDGTHSMTVVLRPENLGPVQIQLTVSRGALDLTLRGAHEQGRAALLDALPDLRRDLQSAGLDCSRLDVDRDTGGSWTARHSSGGDPQGQPPWARSAPGEPRGRRWAADAEPARTAPTTRSTTSATGVDVLV